MAKVIASIFRLPKAGQPVTIVQLAGLPNEVVNPLVSVLARMAFEIALWSDGAYEIAVVCEEAHRYIPTDQSQAFGPTRTAIGRIAKEGRKYGVSLGIVTQRPSELDATVLSQCSTMFAMRLANEHGQGDRPRRRWASPRRARSPSSPRSPTARRSPSARRSRRRCG